MLHRRYDTVRKEAFIWPTTDILRFELKSSNLDSSVQSTFFHWSTAQFLCFLAHLSRLATFTFLNKGFLTATLPLRPTSHKRRATVLDDTDSTFVRFNSAAISRAVSFRFLFECVTIKLSSRFCLPVQNSSYGA